MYLAWFDADRKKPIAQKIAEAHARYVAKFGQQPQICLVNPEDAVADSPIELRPLTHIGRHCFWIGADDVEEAPTNAAPVSAAVAVPSSEAVTPPRPQRTRKASPVAETTTTAAPIAVQQREAPATSPTRVRRTQRPLAPAVEAHRAQSRSAPPTTARRSKEAAPPTAPIKRRTRRERSAA